MTDAQLGWVAGLLEGEGWFGQVRNRPKLQCASTDLDVILRLRNWTGLGSIEGPIHRPNRKDHWKWHVTAMAEASAVMEKVLPLLCERRAEKVTTVLAAHAAAGPKRGTSPYCGYGHELTPENLRLVDGRRRCVTCANRRSAEYRERKRLRETAE